MFTNIISSSIYFGTQYLTDSIRKRNLQAIWLLVGPLYVKSIKQFLMCNLFRSKRNHHNICVN
jgi:hypothetical protein